MPGRTEGEAAPPEPSLVKVLPEVVKGLKHQPVLLFGIGAGTILAAVVGATTNVWLVLVVAAVLALAVAAWLVVELRRQRATTRGIRNEVRVRGADVANAVVGDVAAGGGVGQEVDAADARIKNSIVGRVKQP